MRVMLTHMLINKMHGIYDLIYWKEHNSYKYRTIFKQKHIFYIQINKKKIKN